MKLFEIFNNQTLWYHGTNQDFTDYDMSVPVVSRGTNVAGMYLTPRKYEAEQHGKYIHTYTANVTNPFSNGKTINQNMVSKYTEILLRDTHYKQDWIDTALIPELLERKRLPDIGGDARQELILAGGYDSWLDGDHLCVFNPSKDLTRISD